MAFGGNLDSEETISDINMTPLVDVMLVLLIIFIITVPVLTHSIKIDLPRENNAPNIVSPTTVTLSVNEGAEIYWNDEKIASDELERRLIAAAAQTPQPEFQLHGARKVAYEHIMQVMSAVQQAGIEKLGFVTQPE